MKKLTITFIFSFGLIGALLTACFCKDVQPYWKPVSGTTSVFSVQDFSYFEIFSGDTIQADSVAFTLKFDPVFLSGSNDYFGLLGNAARATQKCPVDGHEGLKYEVTSISISSNEDYNGISAGNDISQFFRFKGELLQNSYSEMFNGFEYDYSPDGFGTEIFLVNQPNDIVERNFTVIVEFENGDSVTMQTLDFTW